ncbi:MAG: metallophosphoesterase [Candidatus Neomarinimicrobiota bacterium]|nr:MAG: metallophosphoesterase [Candidatus Neomarinimicrobiota bacterium]
MRIAVISDIHGNLEAFRAVLEDIRTQHVDKIITLGDLIDYGADSETIIKEHIRLNITAIRGNHEHALIDKGLIKHLSDNASESLRITRKMLSRECLEYINDLPLLLTMDGIRFIHALPPDSVIDYIDFVPFNILGYIFESYPETICFVGHTHKLGIYGYNNGNIKFYPIENEYTKLNPENRYIINAGSVGQPRDRDKHAKYVIFNKEDFILQRRLVDYNAHEAARKIRQSGYPEINAKRLL